MFSFFYFEVVFHKMGVHILPSLAGQGAPGSPVFSPLKGHGDSNAALLGLACFHSVGYLNSGSTNFAISTLPTEFYLAPNFC